MKKKKSTQKRTEKEKKRKKVNKCLPRVASPLNFPVSMCVAFFFFQTAQDQNFKSGYLLFWEIHMDYHGKFRFSVVCSNPKVVSHFFLIVF